MLRKTIIEIITVLFILLFVYAAVSKLLDYEKFRVQLGQSPLLTAFAGWVAWIIPAAEILVSLLLATRRWRLVGLYAAFSLMVMFTAYIIVILNFADYVPCSCGGILQNMGWDTHLIFNSVFVLFALTGIILHSRETDRKMENSMAFIRSAKPPKHSEGLAE